MHRTKYSIARPGLCRAKDDHLVPANDSPHELNPDAAQRELDRRAAEGEDVGKLWVNPESYAIEPRPVTPSQVWAIRYLPNGSVCDLSESGICWAVYPDKAAALADCEETDLDRGVGMAPRYEPALLPPGIPYLWNGAVHPELTQAEHDEMQRLVADLDRDHNKGEKLARRHDLAAVGQLRVALDFEQRELTERDLNLAKAWTGLERSDLDLAGPGPAPGTPGSSLPGCPHGRGLACVVCYPTNKRSKA
jgi:hypothetical protein